MSDDEPLLLGFLFGRYYERRQRQRRRSRRPAASQPRPAMPKRRWRALASVCLLAGVVLGAAIFGAAGWSWARGAVIGGLIGVFFGMLLLETIWERRHR